MSTVIILDPDPELIESQREAHALLSKSMDTPEARVLSLAIALQESRGTMRRQLSIDPDDGKLKPIGPAKGIHQGELGGGMCTGVPRHHATRAHAAQVLAARGVKNNPRAIWNAIERDDVLSFALARLLLFSDPAKLPGLCDVDGGWRYYLRTWRPGKPHFHTWGSCHAAARKALGV
jgi:hypothetical protein